MPSNTEFNDSNNESTNKNRFSIGQLVKTTPQNSNCWDEQTSKLPVGTIGKVVDFGSPEDYDNIIVSFHDLDLDEYGSYNSCQIELLDLGGEI